MENEVKVICKESILLAGRMCKTDHRKEGLESENLFRKNRAWAVIKVQMMRELTKRRKDEEELRFYHCKSQENEAQGGTKSHYSLLRSESQKLVFL